MPQPITTRIQAIDAEAWPHVQKIMDGVQGAISAYVRTSGTPAPTRRRKIIDQTIWVLAQLGHLRTEQETRLAEAAKAWARAENNPKVSDDAFDELTEGLLATIRSLEDYGVVARS